MRLCIKDRCYKYSSFNFENEKIGIYCNNHKKENMINMSKKKCIEDNCSKKPNFNFENEKSGIL